MEPANAPNGTFSCLVAGKHYISMLGTRNTALTNREIFHVHLIPVALEVTRCKTFRRFLHYDINIVFADLRNILVLEYCSDSRRM